ncbi:unnamed protein product, partial [Heterosigma akashiwo]
MSEKNAEGFYAGVQKYIFILVLAAPLFAFSTFARGRLALDWRIWLTHYFSQQYFTDKAFYHLQFSDGDGATKTGRVDNPDQRIAADIESFTSTCVDLIILFGGKVFRVATFLGVLSPSPRAGRVLPGVLGLRHGGHGAALRPPPAPAAPGAAADGGGLPVLAGAHAGARGGDRLLPRGRGRDERRPDIF